MHLLHLHYVLKVCSRDSFCQWMAN